MLNRNLPRNLIGLGGIRLINLPGVSYPKEILQAEKGMNRLTGKPYKIPPEGTICTDEAAKLLNRSLSSTYNFLRKHQATYYYVESKGEIIRTYWRHRDVIQLDAQLPQRESEVPKEMVKAKDVLRILNVVRSTLYRYVASGKVTEIKRRVMTRRGYRHQSLFIRSEIMKLKAWRNARKWQKIAWEDYSMKEKEQREEQVES